MTIDDPKKTEIGDQNPGKISSTKKGNSQQELYQNLKEDSKTGIGMSKDESFTEHEGKRSEQNDRSKEKIQPCFPIRPSRRSLTEKQLKIIDMLKKHGIIIKKYTRKYEYLKLIDEDFLSEIIEILKINNSSSLNEYIYSKDELEIYNYFKKGRIVNNIIQTLEELTKENRTIKVEEVITKIRPNLLTLTINEVIEIIFRICSMVQEFNNIRKYMDFEKGHYKNPIDLFGGYLDSEHSSYREFQKLLKKINKGQGGEKVNNDIITAEQHGTTIVYICDKRVIPKKIGITNKNEYCIVTTRNKEFIEGSVTSIINRDKYYSLPEPERKKHFKFSLLNCPIQYFIPIGHKDIYDRRLQTILCYLKSGLTIEQIKRRIHDNVTNFEYPKLKDIRKRYKIIKNLNEMLLKIENLINLIENSNLGLTYESIIDMLIITPLSKLDEIFSIINNLNTNNSEIWWTGNDRKESIIESILNCNSIHEVKYMLKDPKYSHIGRTSDNKGGIEISAIIDSVIEGNIPSTDIPVEIRQKIEELINNK